MASKLNSEFNYRYQVQGETPWEKIKTLKGFLEGRLRAKGLEEVGKLKLKSKKLKADYMRNEGREWEALELEAEIMEIEQSAHIAEEAYRLNEKEIAIIQKLLAEQYALAEPTRVNGYSDEDMFELNAENEFTVWIAKEIQADIVAMGHPSPAHLRNAMSSPTTFKCLQSIGLIPNDMKYLVGNTDPKHIYLMEAPIETVHAIG